ncbi:MAG: hypothetical protein HWQ35_26890 [Nostoc sp. NMS1]|uniref:hypothetical protein n=1 Tax=unclassified Nostoc TaxID=2593658 RepID=UPI0025EA9DA2|nr:MULTISPECIES: hypothetical protein [unclassified Nostoc]MBN3910036.1 hypothetical protein [Nostoc sp. NMS1]MBN3992217.1 hypothetical protein [Nostoc sp. NMS2]
MKILDRKDAINRRQDERPIIVETAIHRVSFFNRTVLRVRFRQYSTEVITAISDYFVPK